MFCAKLRWGAFRPLTRGGFFLHCAAVRAPETTPFQKTVSWLAAHANFPTSRLPTKAELMVLIVTAAEQEQVALQRSPRFLIESNNIAADASLKAYTMNRSLAHYVCNNAQKT